MERAYISKSWIKLMLLTAAQASAQDYASEQRKI